MSYKDIIKKLRSGVQTSRPTFNPDLVDTQELNSAPRDPKVAKSKENNDTWSELEEHHLDRNSTPNTPVGRIHGIPASSKFGANLDARDEQIERIEAMFGEFGTTISAYMLTQMLSHGGIARTIQRLGLRTRGREGADMIQIENWILTNGTEKFCSVIGIRSKVHNKEAAPPVEAPSSEEGTPSTSQSSLQVREMNPSTENLEIGRHKLTAGGVNRHKITSAPSRTHQEKITFKPIQLGEKKPDPVEEPKIPLRTPTPTPRQSQGFQFSPGSGGKPRPGTPGSTEGGKK
ncbi:MAG: hypothetical protein JJU11_13740 [Candidatus Sumerlaeia bacterium]|nr:hypothetical protein [Candidatus Sumerlaeia bacterium]